MFGSTRKPEETQKFPAPTSPGGLNALVKGTNVEGTLRCGSDLRVDGHVRGKLQSTAKVIIGPNGSVEGEIHCQNAVIEGSFRGILHVADLLSVRETASVEGEIFCQRLAVQSGATFHIVCRMGQQASANGTAAAPAPLAAKIPVIEQKIIAHVAEAVPA